MAYYSVTTGYSERNTGKRNGIIAAAITIALLVGVIFSVNAGAAGGFDQYGYNDKARVFVGAADGVDRDNDGTVWDDPAYAPYVADHLVMKWNKAWDECNDAGQNLESACAGAWTTNHWNGMNPDGSQSTYSYKMIWVGPGEEDSPYWKEGGTPIWDNYEIIAEQGMENGEHYKDKAVAPGLGQKRP